MTGPGAGHNGGFKKTHDGMSAVLAVSAGILTAIPSTPQLQGSPYQYLHKYSEGRRHVIFPDVPSCAYEIGSYYETLSALDESHRRGIFPLQTRSCESAKHPRSLQEARGSIPLSICSPGVVSVFFPIACVLAHAHILLTIGRVSSHSSRN